MRWSLILKKTPTRLPAQGRGRSTKRSPSRSVLIPAHKFIGVNQTHSEEFEPRHKHRTKVKPYFEFIKQSPTDNMAAVLILVFTFMALEGLATLMAVILTCIGST